MNPVYPAQDKSILIYNETCSFCKDTAEWLHSIHGNKLAIVPNTEPWLMTIHKGLTLAKIQKDVHLIKLETVYLPQEYKTTYLYSGAEAVVQVLALNEKLIFLKKIYNFWPFNSIIKLAYFILKKIKKYY